MRAACVASLIVFLLVGNMALADDLNPPAWRGQPGTTFGMWEFSTPNPNPLPDVGLYPYGLPTTEIRPGLFQAWLPTWNGRSGVWPLSGEIDVTIPNNPVPNPYKDIWIQLTWDSQAPGNVPTVSETRFGVASTLVSQVPLADGWFHSTYHIRLQPNPDWERILITGGINADEMVIDTICAPEPAALILLGLGGLLLNRRRFA